MAFLVLSVCHSFFIRLAKGDSEIGKKRDCASPFLEELISSSWKAVYIEGRHTEDRKGNRAMQTKPV